MHSFFLLNIFSLSCLVQSQIFNNQLGQNLTTKQNISNVTASSLFESNTTWNIYPPNLFSGGIGSINFAGNMSSNYTITPMIERFATNLSNLFPSGMYAQFGTTYKGDTLLLNISGLYQYGLEINNKFYRVYQQDNYINYNGSQHKQYSCILMFLDKNTNNSVSVCRFIAPSGVSVNTQKQYNSGFLAFAYNPDNQSVVTSNYVCCQAPKTILDIKYLNGLVILVWQSDFSTIQLQAYLYQKSVLNFSPNTYQWNQVQSKQSLNDDFTIFNINASSSACKFGLSQYFGVSYRNGDSLYFNVISSFMNDTYCTLNFTESQSTLQQFQWKTLLYDLGVDSRLNIAYVQALPVTQIQYNATTNTFVQPYLLTTNYTNVRFNVSITFNNDQIQISLNVDCPYYNLGPFIPVRGAAAYNDIIALPQFMSTSNKTTQKIYYAFGIFQSSNPMFGGNNQSICQSVQSGQMLTGWFVMKGQTNGTIQIKINEAIKSFVLPNGFVAVNIFDRFGFNLFKIHPYVTVKMKFNTTGLKYNNFNVEGFDNTASYTLQSLVVSDPDSDSPGNTWKWVGITIGTIVGVGFIGYWIYYCTRKTVSKAQPAQDTFRTDVSL